MESIDKHTEAEDESVEVYSVNLRTLMKMTGYGKWAIYRRVWSGELKASKDKDNGGQLLFRVADIKKHIDDHIMDIRKPK